MMLLRRMQQLALSLGALVALAHAVPWGGPVETLAPRAQDPRPHEPSLAVMSAVAELQVREFQPKDAISVNTCGWIGGDAKLPAVCSKHSSCVWQTDNSIVGCCAQSPSSNCAIYTSCVDIHSPKPSADRTDVYTCRGTLECYKNTYAGGFEQYGCGKSSWANTVLTEYSGMPKDKTLQIVLTGTDQSTTISETSSTTSSSETRTETSTGTSTVSSEETSSTATATSGTNEAAPHPSATSGHDGSSHKTPVGAIAGGTIGGVAGLSLLAAALFFFVRKRRTNHDSFDITPHNQQVVAELESPKPPYPFETPSTMNSPTAFSRPPSKVIPPPVQQSGPVELP